MALVDAVAVEAAVLSGVAVVSAAWYVHFHDGACNTCDGGDDAAVLVVVAVCVVQKWLQQATMLPKLLSQNQHWKLLEQ